MNNIGTYIKLYILNNMLNSSKVDIGNEQYRYTYNIIYIYIYYQDKNIYIVYIDNI